MGAWRSSGGAPGGARACALRVRGACAACDASKCACAVRAVRACACARVRTCCALCVRACIGRSQTVNLRGVQRCVRTCVRACRTKVHTPARKWRRTQLRTYKLVLTHFCHFGSLWISQRLVTARTPSAVHSSRRLSSVLSPLTRPPFSRAPVCCPYGPLPKLPH